MKKHFISFCFCLFFNIFLTSSTSFAFEGIVELHTTADDKPMTSTTMMLSPQGIRIDLKSLVAENTSRMVILKKDPLIVHQLDATQKLHLQIPLTLFQQAPATEFEILDIQIVGEETLLGYKTIHAALKTNLPLDIQIWIAKDLIEIQQAQQFMTNALEKKIWSALQNRKIVGYPIKTQIVDQQTKSTMITEVTKIRPIKISPKEFAMPSDYKMITPDDLQKMMAPTPATTNSTTPVPTNVTSTKPTHQQVLAPKHPSQPPSTP